MTQPTLQVNGVSKTYGGTRALSDVSLTLTSGSIHAVVGANGSGKSTLVKVLAGVEQADESGTITIGAHSLPAANMTPDTARSLGLRFVHQAVGVFDDLTITENVGLARGFATGKTGRIRWRQLEQLTRRLIDQYEIEATPQTRVSALRPASRMMLAIARALGEESRSGSTLLVLDEPTAALPEHEATLLGERLRRFAQRGQSILFISHHLREILDLSDRVTVLRDGKVAGDLATADLDEERLVTLICGREVGNLFPATNASPSSDEVLRVRGLRSGPLQNVDLTLHRGEIVGVAGLLGSGRSTLLRSLFGNVASEGAVLHHGTQVQVKSPHDAVERGMAYVPEDRGGEANFGQLSLRENVVAPSIREFWRQGRMARSVENRETRDQLTQFSVRAVGPAQPINDLSGGNQQKVIVARWLRRSPWLLLLDEPTQGVDVGARADIYAALRAAADAGMTILIAASDMEELAAVCDRVLVLRRGEITTEFRPPINAEELTVQTYVDTRKVAS